MNLQTIHFKREGMRGLLTLNRPRFLNAMNYQGALDLNAVAEAIRDDSELRLVVIRGEGRAFCTGIDLKQLVVTDHRLIVVPLRNHRQDTKWPLEQLGSVSGP